MNKAFIQRQISSNNTTNSIIYTTTSTTEYIRVSCNNANLATLQIKKVDNLFVGYDNMQSGFLPQSGSYPTTNSSNPNAKYQLIELKQGESVVTRGSSTLGRIRLIDKDTNKVYNTIQNVENEYLISTGNYASSFDNGTITAKKDIVLGIMILNSTFSSNFIISKISPYEPYYDIELCSISDYKDRIYSQNGKLYLEKKTGKVVLDETMTYYKSTTTSIDKYYTRLGYTFDSSIPRSTISNRFIYKPNGVAVGQFDYSQNNQWLALFFCYAEYNTSTINDFKNYVKNNETYCIITLPTATTTEITSENYPTLYSQLLAIQEFLTKYKINKEFLLDYSSPEIEY